MNIFTYYCVSLRDFCDAVGWDYNETSDKITDSDISFGTNDDTLITTKTIARICEKEVPENFDHSLMISLGC